VAVVKVDINAAQAPAGAVREQMIFSETKIFHVPIVAKTTHSCKFARYGSGGTLLFTLAIRHCEQTA